MGAHMDTCACTAAAAVLVIMAGLELMLVFNGGEKITTKLEKKITKSMAM